MLELRNSELPRGPHTALFVSEGERILRSTGSWQDRVKWLLTEALAGTTAVADFDDLPNYTAPTADPWATTATGWGIKRAVMDQHEWFTDLINRAPELRHAVAPRPYWPQCHGNGLAHDGSTARDTRHDFARLIGEFTDSGYRTTVSWVCVMSLPRLRRRSCRRRCQGGFPLVAYPRTRSAARERAGRVPPFRQILLGTKKFSVGMLLMNSRASSEGRQAPWCMRQRLVNMPDEPSVILLP